MVATPTQLPQQEQLRLEHRIRWCLQDPILLTPTLISAMDRSTMGTNSPKRQYKKGLNLNLMRPRRANCQLAPIYPHYINSFLFPSLYHISALQIEGLRIWDAFTQSVRPGSIPTFALARAEGPGSASTLGSAIRESVAVDSAASSRGSVAQKKVTVSLLC
jgi:hypothetical protein